MRALTVGSVVVVAAVYENHTYEIFYLKRKAQPEPVQQPA
jgi:hypothetical protein